MQRMSARSYRQAKIKQIVPMLWFLVAMFITLLGGILLFTYTNESIITQIINTGFDTLRAQLISALILAISAALIGSMFTRRKLGAIVGSTIIFCLYYLLPFIQFETQPVYDAGDHLRPLDINALIHTSIVMIALSILCAFGGAAIGAALYEAVLEQPFLLIRAGWRRIAIATRGQQDSANETTRSTAEPGGRSIFSSAMRWVGLAVLIVMVIFTTQSADLFFLSPDTSIHQAPQTGTINGVASNGTMEKITMVSRVLGNKRRSFEIYLPPTYNITTKHYPTLYLLHGSPGVITDWARGGKATESANTLIGLEQTAEMIMVFPDGNGSGKLIPSEWGNSGNGEQLMETYVASELVHYVDQHYRTIPKADYRAIGGLSMGGFGAANIAIHHPDVFDSVISLGGYFTAYAEPDHVWGRNISYLNYNSPLYEIRVDPLADRLHFFLGAATQDQPYYRYTIQFANQLKAEHISYALTTEPGHHSWKVWSDQLYRSLLWIKWGPTHIPPQIVQR